MAWMRDLDWTDVWHAVAVVLFVAALLIWVDYAGDVVVATR